MQAAWDMVTVWSVQSLNPGKDHFEGFLREILFYDKLSAVNMSHFADGRGLSIRKDTQARWMKPFANKELFCQ